VRWPIGKMWDLRATLDEGPRSRNQWIQAILLVPRPLDEGPRPKTWKIEAKPTWHLFWRKNQLVWTQKTVLKGEFLIWRTKNQAREPRYSPIQGFNLLQISQLVPRKLNPGPSSKVGLISLVVLYLDPLFWGCHYPRV
jgi:hypothetical protein